MNKETAFIVNYEDDSVQKFVLGGPGVGTNAALVATELPDDE